MAQGCKENAGLPLDPFSYILDNNDVFNSQVPDVVELFSIVFHLLTAYLESHHARYSFARNVRKRLLFVGLFFFFRPLREHEHTSLRQVR